MLISYHIFVYSPVIGKNKQFSSAIILTIHSDKCEVLGETSETRGQNNFTGQLTRDPRE